MPSTSTGLPLPALRTHLDDTLARSRRVFEIHFLLVFPVFLAISLFEELYTDLFEPEQAPLKPTGCSRASTTRRWRRIARSGTLSRRALAMPEHTRGCSQLSCRRPSALPWSRRQPGPSGCAFLAELRAYLETYGRRANQCLLSAPTWVEDPTPVSPTCSTISASPTAIPQAELAELAAERDHLVAAARARLKAIPGPVVSSSKRSSRRPRRRRC